MAGRRAALERIRRVPRRVIQRLYNVCCARRRPSRLISDWVGFVAEITLLGLCVIATGVVQLQLYWSFTIFSIPMILF